jgi:hypothetical protein
MFRWKSQDLRYANRASADVFLCSLHSCTNSHQQQQTSNQWHMGRTSVRMRAVSSKPEPGVKLTLSCRDRQNAQMRTGIMYIAISDVAVQYNKVHTKPKPISVSLLPQSCNVFLSELKKNAVNWRQSNYKMAVRSCIWRNTLSLDLPFADYCTWSWTLYLCVMSWSNSYKEMQTC